MDDPTSKFRNALPYAVLPISPTLAALHSKNGRGEEWCLKCGSYLLGGNAEIQVTHIKSRKRGMPLTRLLRKTCLGCGWSNDTLIATRPPPSISQASSAYIQPHPIKTPPLPTALPTSSLQEHPVLPSIPTKAQPKQRPKTKAGLQEMLSRNRQKKEAQQKNEGQISTGLAAFLSGL